MKPARGYAALRLHRWSHPGFTYFLTLCTKGRARGLTDDGVAQAIRSEINACEADGHWRVRGAVIMPEHVHLLVALTGALPLGRVVARLKAQTRAALTAGRTDLCWQGNYYEHRLRPDEPVEDVLRYIFLNPFRTEGVPATGMTETYPWFWLHPDEAAWFTPRLDDDGRPFPEWLR